jgi:hypothetical protein
MKYTCLVYARIICIFDLNTIFFVNFRHYYVLYFHDQENTNLTYYLYCFTFCPPEWAKYVPARFNAPTFPPSLFTFA